MPAADAGPDAAEGADLARMIAAQLPQPGATLLVAVSGGADSMALLHLLHQGGHGPLVVFHLDHGLRRESAADARFVVDLPPVRWDCARWCAAPGCAP